MMALSTAWRSGPLPDRHETNDLPEGGKRDRRTERRLKTRAALLRAARRLIDRGHMNSISVEDLCQEADISRAAFYLHFPNKDALLKAVQEEMVDWYMRHLLKLDEVAASSEDGIFAWLSDLIAGSRKAANAILLVTDRSRALVDWSASRRDEMVQALAARVPQFRILREDGQVDEERKIRLLLLLFQVEQLCGYLAIDAPREGDLPVWVLARQFTALIDEQPHPGIAT